MNEIRQSFNSLYRHGFVRAVACTPLVRVAAPPWNLEQTLSLARQASQARAAVAVFPELGLSAYSNDDLFFQDALLDAVEHSLHCIVRDSRDLMPLLMVGAPIRAWGRLFNCAVVIHQGRILGVVPKTYLPNYREYYEKRQFTPGPMAVADSIALAGERVPFGNDLLFEATDCPDLVLHAEICEDLWAPVPPSTRAAVAGATVLCNLSASNVTIGKAEYRRLLCASHSARCLAAYVYATSAFGESSTDMAWDGHAMIHENGELLAESERFADRSQLISADLDLERLRQDRTRATTFIDSLDACAGSMQMRRIGFTLNPPAGDLALERRVERFPYVPADPATRDERCAEAYHIQVAGLMQRLQATGLERLVIGVSGGLDSTHALMVCAKTMDRLGLPRQNILGYGLRGFATTAHTRRNAGRLMRALGVSAGHLDIRPASRRMLKAIDHPYARGQEHYDLTFENVQAGERTSHLFRLANRHDAMVVGTSDLSELALGFTTYGVGDHMAHYHVNASVPKTLIQHLIRWVIGSREFSPAVGRTLQSILETDISPELIPGRDGQALQRSEDVVGPYPLQDFNLYYISRYGYRPSKVAFLARHAWGDPQRGAWPEGLPADQRRGYDVADIKHWLEVFLLRFLQYSQFKRSAMPNAPKVGSGGSLSPRGDWRAPSDASAEVWLEELRSNVP